MINEELLLYRLTTIEELLRAHTEQDKEQLERLTQGQAAINISIAHLQARSSLWGALAGIVGGGLISSLIAYFFHMVG